MMHINLSMIKVKHKSNLSALKKSIELLGKSRVYVGIPAENASRDNGNEEREELATLIFVFTNGIRLIRSIYSSLKISTDICFPVSNSSSIPSD